MRAVAIDGFGGREVMRLTDLPAPRPQPGEVGVRMAFASVNPADWKLREGWLNTFPSFRPSFPFVLGYDGAGIVESVGEHERERRAKGWEGVQPSLAQFPVGRIDAGEGHAHAHLARLGPGRRQIGQAHDLPPTETIDRDCAH